MKKIRDNLLITASANTITSNRKTGYGGIFIKLECQKRF
jgi:hypothetical protein